MGVRYKQSEHFLSFYKKLLFEDAEIKKLESYPDFLTLKNETFSKTAQIHKKYFKVSFFNRNLQSILNSFVSAETIYQLLWVMAILFIFGQGLELILGHRLYLFSIVFGSLAAMYSYLSSMTESVQVISGEFIILCFILGTLFGIGRRVNFYFTKEKKISLRSVVFTLWIFQELALHFYHPLTTAHLAHFFSFAYGVGFGLFFNYKNNLPFGFLSPKVNNYWEGLKRHHNLEHQLNVGMHILEENPDNYTVKKDILVAILDAQLKGDQQIVYWNYLEIILPDLVSIYSLQESKHDLVLQMLKLVPEGIPLHPYLKKMKMKKYKILIEMAKKKNELIVFIKLLESSLIHHQKSAKYYTEQALNLEAMDLKSLNLEDKQKKDVYRKYILNSQSPYLQSLLMPFLRA